MIQKSQLDIHRWQTASTITIASSAVIGRFWLMCLLLLLSLAIVDHNALEHNNSSNENDAHESGNSTRLQRLHNQHEHYMKPQDFQLRPHNNRHHHQHFMSATSSESILSVSTQSTSLPPHVASSDQQRPHHLQTPHKLHQPHYNTRAHQHQQQHHHHQQHQKEQRQHSYEQHEMGISINTPSTMSQPKATSNPTTKSGHSITDTKLNHQQKQQLLQQQRTYAQQPQLNSHMSTTMPLILPQLLGPQTNIITADKVLETKKVKQQKPIATQNAEKSRLTSGHNNKLAIEAADEDYDASDAEANVNNIIAPDSNIDPDADATDYYYYSDDESYREKQNKHRPQRYSTIYNYDSLDDDGGWQMLTSSRLSDGKPTHQPNPQQQHQHGMQKQHARVARDHHRLQSRLQHQQPQHQQNNHLAYETRNEDEDYPDDEPYRTSAEQYSQYSGSVPGLLTAQKFRELGTMEAVQQSRDRYMQERPKSPYELATDHVNRMKLAARCSRPLPRVFHVSNDTSKMYVPSCTILHRCGEDTGCCRSMGQVCTVKTYEDVPLHFFVVQVNSGSTRRQTETLWLRNDTECHCVERSNLTSDPEFITRDKRSGLAQQSRVTAFLDSPSVEDSDSLQMALEAHSYLNNGVRGDSIEDVVCRCPRHFDVFEEDMGWQLVHQRHAAHSRGAHTVNCRCDCLGTIVACQRFKNGEEGFAMDDRKCIVERICSVPTCTFGIYNQQFGRCPRPSRKQKRPESGFG